MALDFICDNIRVNCICPGGVSTWPEVDHSDAPYWKTRKYPETLSWEQRVKMHPIGRQGEPEEIAEAMMWLVDPANKFHSRRGDRGGRRADRAVIDLRLTRSPALWGRGIKFPR